ncbi:hypothetical protein HU200_058337 [Digitaria exilis]|uniref:Uncharacterized protein n=1 Tax=Digitaria exilis TaxID=1010633 RepID=A0A835AJN0_9POAL|nr:hypothetical protein HU200_058337 [Digitaria exilis]CAB3461966.1 unnamed protein product [Digitaria exilis]
MAASTLRDVLYSHIKARESYERFMEIGCNPERAGNTVALLLWLDHGCNNVIRHVPGLTTTAVFHLANEAKGVIDCLSQNVLMVPPTPLMSALCQDNGIDPAAFAYRQDLLVHGVADILDGIGNQLIFSDRLYYLLRRHQTGLLGRNMELEAPYAGCAPVIVPEDCRSMFITFSRNQAVERDEIFDYFRHKWGDCIVRVLLEKTNGGAQPMYGRVIFKSPAFVSLALNGEERVSIIIREREIWLRKYIPRQNNNV